MPFTDVPVSPRPLPPGRVRRSSSKPQLLPAGSPSSTRAPPPYTPVASGASETRSSTPDLLQQLTCTIDEGSSVPAPVYLDGSTVSTEDLEGLLLRAGNIIREREQELDITSQTCKTLSENNATLKARNDALLARLPSSKPTSPVSSPPQTFTSLSSLSPSISATLSPSLSGPTCSRQRHTRKPSAPAELAALADQNAELLSKLQDLESDAARSEQAGKRRLRVLEREIGMLKEELDKTRALGERLEESLQSQAGGSTDNGEGKGGLPEEMERELIKVWKRLAREAKVKEMRAKTRPWEVEESERKDFAPSNPLFAPVRTSTPDKRSSIFNEASSSSQYRASTEPEFLPERSADPDDPFQSAAQPLAGSYSETLPTLPASSTATISPGRERAIVAQLLAKIAELEETNTTLAEEHQTSQARLREAEREADGVRALCEIISEEVELEIVDSHEEGGGEPGDLLGERYNEFGGLGNRRPELSPRKTIRLRSLGRKSSLNFRATDREIQLNEGRLRKFSSMDNLALGSGHHTCWDSAQQINVPVEDERQGLRPRKSIPRMRKSMRGLFESSLTSTDSPASSTSHSEFGLPGIAEGPVSPDRESGRFNFPPPQIITSPSPDSFRDDSYLPEEERHLPSLSSEMGGEAGLGLMPSMSHMRSNSIVELLSKVESEPAPGGATFPPSPPTHVSNAALSLSLSRRRGLGVENGSMSNSSRKIPRYCEAGGSTKKYAEDDLSMRAASLSEEVMFPRLRRATSSILSSHSMAFDNQVLGVLHEKQEPHDSVRQPNLDQSLDTPDTPEKTSAVNEKHQRKQRTRSAALLIELWLWLQFAVVIVVFLFAMARMGPRTFFRKSKATTQRLAGH